MALSRESVSDPSMFFGQIPGSDYTLISWDDMPEWFLMVQEASARMVVQSLGTATEGSPMDLLIIISEGSIRDLEGLRRQRETLSDIGLLSDPGNVHGTRGGQKPVVLITAGIHATEVGGVQLMPELVQELALSDDPGIGEILDRVIILIVPTLNPDGMQSVQEWYERTRGTPAEGTAPPCLYQPYAGHDNNRDWYTHALRETVNTVEGVHRPWRPHILVDLHQMGEDSPRYVVPPYLDPVEPHVHPRITALSNEVGAAIAASLVRNGHRGASSGVLFDAYSPTRAFPHYHGGVRILAEAASAKIATPLEVSLDQVKPRRGFDPNLPTVHNPSPWQGGTWRLRDIIDYHLTAIRAVLEHVATYADRWIRDQWSMLADEVTDSQPAVYLIAPMSQQLDPPATRILIETLLRGDVIVEYVETGSDVVQTGSFLVRSNQPFGSYARALLDLTPYPVPRADEHGGKPPAPYDVTSHCLPLHLGIDARRVDGHVNVRTRAVEREDFTPFAPPRASEVDRAHWLAIDARSHRSVTLVLSALRNGASVRRLLRSHIDSGRLLPAGTWLITDDHADAAKSEVHTRGLRSWLVTPFPLSTAAQSLPRIGLHVPWMHNAIDAGWARLVLEQLEFEVDIIRDEDVRQGDLSGYDVLLFPSLPEKDLLQGNSVEVYPREFAGGLGRDGVARLGAYLRQDGHIVAIDAAASAFVSELRLPVQRPLTDLKQPDFYCPGSVLRVVPDPSHPVALGMDESRPVMFINSTAFIPAPGMTSRHRPGMSRMSCCSRAGSVEKTISGARALSSMCRSVKEFSPASVSFLTSEADGLQLYDAHQCADAPLS